MRIQDVVKKTGLQKRTIYYYIKERLIKPAVDSRSSYNSFSDDDVRRLLTIKKLRDIGMSIANIRSILLNPRTAGFYLHKQLNAMQMESLVLQKTLENLDEFVARFPACRTVEELEACFADASFKPDIPDGQLHLGSRDARLISQYLWQAYTNVPMTEYRQFLWQKVVRYTEEQVKSSLRIFSLYLQHISPEQLDNYGIIHSLRDKRIISLTADNIPAFTEELKASLLSFAKDKTQLEQWHLLYEPVIRPATLFGFACSPLLSEFNPDYSKYYENIHSCCMLLKQYLDSAAGQKLHELLSIAFGKGYDFDESSYGEFEVAASFSQSVYSLLRPSEIREFLVNIM
jgi:DNA-binding transcriptional MerR regulator